MLWMFLFITAWTVPVSECASVSSAQTVRSSLNNPTPQATEAFPYPDLWPQSDADFSVLVRRSDQKSEN